jgi:hypothetical protein
MDGIYKIAIRTPLWRIPAVDSGVLPSALRANAYGVVQNRSRRFCRGIETSCPATRFSNGSHFQWLTAIKNDGTSLCRAQHVEKRSFSTSC